MTGSAANKRIAARIPLMIPELFLNILEHLVVFNRTERRTLAALARTCRAFSEPSLNRLWKKLSSLKPLVRCYMGAGEVKDMVPPTSSQFAVIDRYSCRIREITISDNISVRLLRHTSMRTSALLQNLMVLRWIPDPHTGTLPSILLIHQLLRPSLISIHASLDENDGAALSFLDNHPFLCPNLKSVEFYFLSGPPSAMVTGVLSRAICRQVILESVVIDAPIDASALRHLAMLPTLRVVSIRLAESSESPDGAFLPSDPLFYGAKELRFISSNLPLVSSLLRPHKQVFHSFRLTHRNRLRSETIGTFLDLLTSRSTTEPLQSLTLSVGGGALPFMVDEMASEALHYRLSYRTLRPLVTLKALRTLWIDWSEQISLDDEELTSLASSLPLLEIFRIYCGCGGYPPFSSKYPTLRGLLILVDACPELSVVALPLDAREIPVVKERKSGNTKVTALCFPESPISEALPVAEFLIQHLPSVRMVDGLFMTASSRRTYGEAWKQVDAHLRKIYFLPSDSSAESESDSDA